MQCPKCQHENRDEAKFCEECGEKLQLKCPNCGSELRPNAKFCDECGAKVSEQVSAKTVTIPKLEDMHTQLQSLIPDELAQKYMAAEQQAIGENRPITALFVDISGFTPLSAARSSEQIFQLVQDCFKQLVGIVARYEGGIGGFRGDALIALFGAPILHENDAERAILAAIDMRRIMEDRQLGVSIGINTAMMTVGEVQTQLLNEYTAYGIDVILAQRLQDTAKAGQILVGSGTYRLTRRAFDFEELPSLELQGFSQPVTAYILQKVKSHPEKLRGIEGLRARMVGRDREYQELMDVTEEWSSGKGQIVSIIGEAGIGKSRLVQELREYLEDGKEPESQKSGVLVMEGRCVSIGQPISYWPFLDILRGWYNLSEDDTEAEMAGKVKQQIESLLPDRIDDILPFMGHLINLKFGGEIDSRLAHYSLEQIKHGIMMRLRDIFVAMTQQTKLMLVLEDLHWADELSLDLISLLMDELMAHPLMLVCVYRPEQGHSVARLSSIARRKCLERYTEIGLKPLPDPEGRRLVHELLAIDDLPDSVRDMILGKSEGNPFFIEEVIRSLMEQGLVYKDGNRWKAKADVIGVQVPDTIQSVILERVDRLEAEARYVLQCASVIGRLFKYRLLDHITQKQKELDQYLDDFEKRDLTHPERTFPEMEYAFKHALTQEATYQGIIEQRRQAFHRNVALGIERLYQERIEDFYEELVYHWEHSRDKEKTLEYLVKAGQKAAKNYLNDIAIDYYTQAIKMAKEIGISSDKLAEIYDARGQVYYNINYYEECVSDMIEALNFYATRPKRASIYAKIANAYMWAINDADEAGRYARRIIEEVDPADKSRDTVSAYRVAASTVHSYAPTTYSCTPEECESYLLKAISISEEMGYKDLLASQYIDLDLTYRDEAGLDENHEKRRIVREKALFYLPYLKPILAEYADACLILAYNSSYDIEKSMHFYGESVKAGMESGNVFPTILSAAIVGPLYLNIGDIQKAIETYEIAWQAGVRSRFIHRGWFLDITRCLIELYTPRNERQKLLNMMLQMVDSTLILHSKPKAHPTVQYRWNNQVDKTYNMLHDIAPDVYPELMDSLKVRLNEAGADGERFFYHSQLMLLDLLDGRHADAEANCQEMMHLLPNAGSFADRISVKIGQAMELIGAQEDQRQGIAANLLEQADEFQTFHDALTAIGWVLAKDAAIQIIDWDQVDQLALDFLLGRIFWALWIQVQQFYESYEHGDRLMALAGRVWQAKADALNEHGITQLLLEPVKTWTIGTPEFTDGFSQDPIASGWEWLDPTGDCVYWVHGPGIEITVPIDHNMYNNNYPGLLREIWGDFVIETCLTLGRDKQSTYIYQDRKGGGLFIWKDGMNAILLETLFNYWASGESNIDIVYMETKTADKFTNPGLFPFMADRVWLRMERKGYRFTGYVSKDGENWYRCGWVDILMEDPIKAGINALCSHLPATTTRFEYFKLFRSV